MGKESKGIHPVCDSAADDREPVKHHGRFILTFEHQLLQDGGEDNKDGESREGKQEVWDMVGQSISNSLDEAHHEFSIQRDFNS